MRTNRLYDRLLSELQDRYLRYLPDSATVGILTFETDVKRDRTYGPSERTRLRGALDELRAARPSGRYTFLTGAVYESSRWIEELRSTAPFDRAQIYIFTDGHNEPPPGASGPMEWEDLLSKEFGSYLRDDVGVYVVQLEGASSMSCPIPNCQVLPPGGGPGELTRGALRFRSTELSLAPVEVVGGREGEAEVHLRFRLEAALSTPEGQPKRVKLVAPPGTRVEPAQAEFAQAGSSADFDLLTSIKPPMGEIRSLIAVRALGDFDVDSVVSVRAPIRVVPPSIPLWRQPWFLVLVALAVLVISYQTAFPRFPKTVSVKIGGVPYPLRQLGRFPFRNRVKLGPRRGVLLGRGSTHFATMFAHRGGRVTIVPARGRVVAVSGTDLTGRKILSDGDNIRTEDGTLVFERFSP